MEIQTSFKKEIDIDCPALILQIRIRSDQLIFVGKETYITIINSLKKSIF